MQPAFIASFPMKKLSIALIGLAMAGPVNAHVLAPKEAGRDVVVLAHRACWEGGAPEVSVAAIRACDAIQPDMVEIDVRKTRDGQYVLMHDATVDRMTNGKGAIADMTAAQIRALYLRAGDGGPDAPLTSERVPTLEEGLKAAKGKFLVNLHLYIAPEPGIAEIVKRLGMAGQVTTWVGGSPEEGGLANFPMRGAVLPIPIVKECAASADNCKSRSVGSLTGYAPYRPAGFYIIPNGSVSSETAQDFIRGGAAAPRPAGTRIMASTLFDVDNLPPEALRAEWRRLIGLGVDMIMTDHPAALLDFLRREGSSGN